MNAAIAQHLNVAESAIMRIEEWAHVLFVVCKKIGARFVSKRVIEKMKFSESGQLYDRKLFVSEDKKYAIAQGERPDSSFFNPLKWNKEKAKWDWLDNGRASVTFAGAVERLAGEATSAPAKTPVVKTAQRDRAFALASGMVQTSSGAWVDESDWMESQESGIDL